MAMHALVFTDVVDSTMIVERLGDERAAQLWVEHDRRARELLARHGGREIDRTDGFFALFESISHAARFALDYHEALRGLEVAARVGLHVGNVTLRENAPVDVARGAKPVEIEGLAKPFAARVMALARGGQTLLSADARAALGDPAIKGAVVDSHGHFRLKGIELPVELFEIGVEGLNEFAPPADTPKAYRVVRAGDVWAPIRSVRQNLPAERDAFIGRAAELRRLAQRLDDEARLITVLGPGGIGKTRFVARYARTWLGDWPGGVYFCDLSEARTLDGVYRAVAIALDVSLGKAEPSVQLGHAIAGRARCLVILDNFEQVAPHAPATVGAWLDRAAEASFVVTSRERLHLRGETPLALDPLPLGVDAIELFVARAAAQQPAFALNDTNRADVAEVVRLLDGLPLAIELAAARIGVLSPTQLVARMRDRFRLLAGTRDAAARHATLRAAIDWSWELLAPWEQAAFAQCSAFEGGFTLLAAEAVLDVSQWPQAPETLDIVQALVDKSLVRTDVRAGTHRYDIDEPHFGMYVSIHEYARQRLDDFGRDGADWRHGTWFAGFGSDAAIDALAGPDGMRLRRSLTLELDNLVAACRRAVDRGDGAIAVGSFRAAWEVLALQGPFVLASHLAMRVLALPLTDEMRATMCMIAAMAAWRGGQGSAPLAMLEEGLALAQALGDRRREAGILRNMGILLHQQGHPEQARSRLEASLAIARSLGDRRSEGPMLGNLGGLHDEQGRADAALAHYVEALEVLREVGNRRDEGVVLGNLAALMTDQGRLSQAAVYYEQALVIHREGGNRRDEGGVLGNMGVMYHQLGQSDSARACYEQALPIHRDIGNRNIESSILANLGVFERERGRPDAARAAFEQALVIIREVGNRRVEGAVLGSIGVLHLHAGRIEEALEALRAGERLLREIDDRFELAKLLCARGQAECALGDCDTARQALAEAEAAAVALGSEPDSELSREAARLREKLAAQPS